MKIYLAVLLVIYSTLTFSKEDTSFLTYLTYETNTYENNTLEHSESLAGDFYISHDMGDLNNFTFYAGFNNDFNSDDTDNINDAYLSFSKRFKGESFFGKIELRGYLPLSERSREEVEMYTRTTLRGLFGVKLVDIKTFQLSLSYSPYYTEYFNRYDTTVSGQINTKRSLLNRFVLNGNFSEKLNIQVIYDIINSWTENEVRREDAYSLQEEISYSFTNSFALAIGHINSNNLRDYDSNAQVVEIYDEDTSSFYFQIYQSF
jgi:hypothetical protein